MGHKVEISRRSSYRHRCAPIFQCFEFCFGRLPPYSNAFATERVASISECHGIISRESLFPNFPSETLDCVYFARGYINQRMQWQLSMTVNVCQTRDANVLEIVFRSHWILQLRGSTVLDKTKFNARNIESRFCPFLSALKFQFRFQIWHCESRSITETVRRFDDMNRSSTTFRQSSSGSRIGRQEGLRTACSPSTAILTIVLNQT